MKESNFLAGNVSDNFLRRVNLLNTKGQYMKESNTLAGNATIKQHQKENLLITQGQYMKESDILADNAANILLKRQIFVDTK